MPEAASFNGLEIVVVGRYGKNYKETMSHYHDRWAKKDVDYMGNVALEHFDEPPQKVFEHLNLI